MRNVTIKGLEFEPYISREQIDLRLNDLAAKIEEDFSGQCPIFICVLNGAFAFAADLFRKVRLESEITFIKLQSYIGTGTTGKVKEIIGLNTSIEGRPVIIVEDIVDTGITMYNLICDLRQRGASIIKVASLLHKPDALQKEVTIDYLGFSIPNKFIVGYGLDLDGLARNLPDIYILRGTIDAKCH